MIKTLNATVLHLGFLLLSLSFHHSQQTKQIKSKKEVQEVIIVGASYAGLSVAMALGKSLRKTLLIDSGKPCNRQTPHSHNFLSQDGKTPAEISTISREQVLAYPQVQLIEGPLTEGRKTADGFELKLSNGDTYV